MSRRRSGKSGEHSLGSAVPAGVGQGCSVVGAMTLAGVSAAGGERYINRSREARLIVYLPDMVERDLWLVIKVITRVAVLAVAIVADSGVIEVRTAAVHIVAGLLPALDGETVLRATLVMGLR